MLSKHCTPPSFSPSQGFQPEIQPLSAEAEAHPTIPTLALSLTRARTGQFISCFFSSCYSILLLLFNFCHDKLLYTFVVIYQEWFQFSQGGLRSQIIDQMSFDRLSQYHTSSPNDGFNLVKSNQKCLTIDNSSHWLSF